MKILHLNDKVVIRGGVEVYIDQLCQYGEDFGMGMDWLAIYKSAESQYVLEGIKTNTLMSNVLKIIKYSKCKNF